MRRAGEPGPEELTGVAGMPVRLIETASLGAWISDGDDSTAPSVDRLREHDAVVTAAMRTATPLPVRYGSCFASEERLLAALSDDEEKWLASLRRVAGHVEMGIRVRWLRPPRAMVSTETDASEKASPRSGREYLERRRESHAAAESVRREAASALDRVSDALGMPELESTRTLLPRPDIAGLLAHLVQSGALELYHERVQEMRSRFDDLDIEASGPWAPYSFV